MTTAPGVAVVATQLAQTDRRALSQAWYSALHLAGDAPHTASPVAPHANASAPPAHRAPAAPASETAIHPSASRGASPRIAHARTNAPLDRRTPPSETARRVERAVERIAHAPRWRTSHTVAIDGGRVTLLVRSDAGTTRVVALCSEPLRSHVERALAHARFVLAVRGTAVHAS